MGVVEVAAKKGSHPAAQIVFVDTPGVHKPGSQLDRRMLQEVYEALETRDLVLVLMDATRRVQLAVAEGTEREKKRDVWTSEDEFLFGLIRKIDCPVFLLLTKIDLVPKDRLLPMIDLLTRQYEFCAGDSDQRAEERWARSAVARDRGRAADWRAVFPQGSVHRSAAAVHGGGTDFARAF